MVAASHVTLVYFNVNDKLWQNFHDINVTILINVAVSQTMQVFSKNKMQIFVRRGLLLLITVPQDDSERNIKLVIERDAPCFIYHLT